MAAEGVVPHCARCGAATFLCSCSGVPTGQDIVFPFPKLPEDATPQQRLERWQLHVTMNPSARQFDAARFVADMQAQGLVQCLERVRPQLESTAAHYCEDTTEHGYMDVYHIMAEKLGEERYSKAKCRGEVQLAVQRFLSCDWSRMAMWDVAVVNSVYQLFPLDNPDLELSFNVLSCLLTVLEMASSRICYAFEPFDWQ